MTSPSQTLGKEERLGEKRILDNLFLNGEKIHIPGLALRWKMEKKMSKVGAKVAFSVPKRLFKKAVTRNLLKRRMREVYRKNKPFTVSPSGEYDNIYYLVLIYTANKINPYTEIESKIVLILQHLKKASGIAK